MSLARSPSTLPTMPGATLFCAAALIAFATLTGCARGRMYSPSDVPRECLAPHTENVHTVDFSKLADVSVSNELIDRGDVLDVTIETGYGKSNERENTFPVRVADDGFANVPLVGRVPLAGLELDAAEQAIKAQAVGRALYRDPTITVVMRKQRVNKVTVIGAVNKPGTYELPRGNSNLLQALVAAGHLAKDAGPEVEIRRPALRSQGPPLMPAPSEQPNEVAGGNHAERTSYNAAPAIMRPASSMKVNLVVAAREARGGYYLDDGDVVMVEKKMVPPIHVLGLVQKPGQFELPPHQDLHLLDAIALAGGRSMQFADKVHIIRHVPGKEQPIVVKISMRDAKRTGEGNMRLAPGDIVSVEETPVTMVLETVKGLFSFGASFGVL